jgi:hypothetical protein
MVARAPPIRLVVLSAILVVTDVVFTIKHQFATNLNSLVVSKTNMADLKLKPV